jgi:hypothetical protein
MADEFLGDRKKALEESFFVKENTRLLERIRAESATKNVRQSLSEISGIEDAEVLDKLITLDIGPDTWAAISVVPLVEVAWADGKVEDRERRAVLSAAEANGVFPGSPSFELLESWLRRRPDARLMGAWGEYIVDLCEKFGATERNAVRDKVLGRAREVAQATGGFLGFGPKISPEEQIVLDELAKAFE